MSFEWSQLFDGQSTCMHNAVADDTEWHQESDARRRQRRLAGQEVVKSCRDRCAKDAKSAAEKERQAPPDFPATVYSTDKNDAICLLHGLLHRIGSRTRRPAFTG